MTEDKRKSSRQKLAASFAFLNAVRRSIALCGTFPKQGLSSDLESVHLFPISLNYASPVGAKSFAPG
jgi:hypothetical protein